MNRDTDLGGKPAITLYRPGGPESGPGLIIHPQVLLAPLGIDHELIINSVLVLRINCYSNVGYTPEIELITQETCFWFIFTHHGRQVEPKNQVLSVKKCQDPGIN